MTVFTLPLLVRGDYFLIVCIPSLKIRFKIVLHYDVTLNHMHAVE